MTDQSASTGRDPAKYRRILDTAAGEFARVGFEQANVDAIARQAGVAKGTVYLYFENKRALFRAILEELRRRLQPAVALGDGRDPAGALRRFIQAHLELADAAPDLFRCYTSALFGVNREFQEAALATFEWQTEELQRLGFAYGDDEAGHERAALLAGSVLSAALIRNLHGTGSTDTALAEQAIVDGALATMEHSR